MNLKEQIKASWAFVAAGGIFILLAILSVTGACEINDIYFGLGKILLALTITYTCVPISKSFNQKGKYATSRWLVYGAGLLSGLWLYDGIKYFL